MAKKISKKCGNFVTCFLLAIKRLDMWILYNLLFTAAKLKRHINNAAT
jgi:hypothetical protein